MERITKIDDGKIGPHSKCPCRSGKKYKKCCMQKRNLNFKKDVQISSEKREILVPQGYGKDPLTKFVVDAEQNIIASYANYNTIFKGLNHILDIFTKINEYYREKGFSEPELVPLFFLNRAKGAFLASMRIGLAGQIPECYPLLRLTLEYSLYALKLKDDIELTKLWLSRHVNEENRKKIRKCFTITDMKKCLKEIDSETGEIVDKLYEELIDFGAHPNERGITANLESDMSIVLLQRGDALPYKYCIKTIARIGICSLLVYECVFGDCYRELSLHDELVKLRQGL